MVASTNELGGTTATGDVVSTMSGDGVLVIRLANPARRNVLDPEMTTRLARALTESADAAVIVLLAEGDHFCVGGDVKAFGAAADVAEYVGALAAGFHEVVRAMRDSTAPIIVGQRGWAAGAGMSIVLAADVVIAGESAALRPAYPGIGVTPDGGMSWTLPRIVGHRRALSILLGDQVLSAKQAYQLGIFDDLVTDDVVDAQAIAFARRLARGSTGSLAGIKKLVQDGTDRTLEEHLQAEAASIAIRAASPEGQEGIHAFLERRRPDFPAVNGVHERS